MTTVSTVDVHLLELPLTEPFVASHGETLGRTIVVIRVDTDTGRVGWGECSALPAATYTAESTASAYRAIVEDMAQLIIGTDIRTDATGETLADFRDQPMAVAGLEMAVLDTALKAQGRSLAHWLGVDAKAAPAGVSIGLDTVDATVEKAVGLAADGYRRLKVKIQPGHDVDLVRNLRRALPTAELQVDANGAYPSDAIDNVLELVRLGADALEQPFAAEDHDAAAELIERLAQSGDGSKPVPVVADEAVASMADAEALLAARAMTGLSIKPARVGGLAVALSLHELCRSNGIAATAGGMLETGLGRHSLAALAGLPGFTLTGDLSPAARWLAADPWPDLEMVDGAIVVPDGPGVAPEPDPYILDRYRLEQQRIG